MSANHTVAWISEPDNLWRSKLEWFWAIPPPLSGLSHLRIVAEEDGRAHPVLRFVEHDGHRIVQVLAHPNLRAVRAYFTASITILPIL